MKRGLMDILVCPACKGTLSLSVTEEDGREIVSGRLRCTACRVDYPIVATIPHLLPPQEVAQSGT